MIMSTRARIWQAYINAGKGGPALVAFRSPDPSRACDHSSHVTAFTCCVTAAAVAESQLD
jgi:hypothetical protein